MKAKTLRLTSLLPASIDEIWERLQRLDTLQSIAAPYAGFEPLDSPSSLWAEGKSFAFRLRIFGFIPLGVHSIKVVHVNRDAGCIQTCETNPVVPVWNHKIILREVGPDTTQYTDEVEIYAHGKTGAVYLWSQCFYRHRQKKWRSLLANGR